jgi:hypothetical protein
MTFAEHYVASKWRASKRGPALLKMVGHLTISAVLRFQLQSWYDSDSDQAACCLASYAVIAAAHVHRSCCAVVLQSRTRSAH